MTTDKSKAATYYPTPKELGSEASRFWKGALSAYKLEPDECRILVDICREIDIVNRIERVLRNEPDIVRGSQGQPVSNPLFAEARQHRLALASLIKQLGLAKRTPAAGTAKDRRAADVINIADKWRNAGS